MSVDPPFPKPPAARLALNEHDALPAGTRFGEFEIIRALGVGGFGIVYLAQDHSLERQVALKEYMPASLAARGAGAMITIRASSFAETYAIGLRSFINEARLLARFDHPSLVKVYRFWEDNGTAYMVMPYLQGRTLRDVRRALGGPPDEAWIRGMLDPMLDALDLLHREGVFHRDIAPDNILINPEGVPVLLDFGAARRVISDRTQSLTAILKPSYAPIEQYAEMAAMRQGPWTDIYALGAVLHYLMFGLPPEPATARAVQPDAELIEQRVVPGVSPPFMSVVAWMLGVRPLERPQNVASVRAALNGTLAVPHHSQHQPTVPMIAKLPASAFRPTAVDVADAAPALPAAGDPAVAATEVMTRRMARESEPEVHAEPAAWPATQHVAPVADAGWPDTEIAARQVPATRPAAAEPRLPAAATGLTPARSASAPGSAPLRSTPPGTAPPAYVPPPRPPRPAPAAAPAVAQAVADEPPTVNPPRSRRGLAFAGGVGALALAALVLWQFIGVIGKPRPVDAASLAAAVAPMPVVASAVPLKTQAPAAAYTGPTVGQVASVPPWGDGASAPTAGTKPLAPHTAAVAVPAPVAVSALAPTAQASSAAPPPEERTETRRQRLARNAQAERAEARDDLPATPREACGKRTFISLALCMDRQCERPRFKNLPECVRMDEARRRRAGNY